MIKRTFDALAAFAGLLVAIVPLCLVALLVKATSQGPALFIQVRVGRYGRTFKCLKFRTMVANSEQTGTVTTAGDKRITPVGRFLRRYKLDELPQLWNVLTGDMSFVGPRPDVPGYADQLQGEDRRILELLPGITGPATLRFKDEEAILAEVSDPQRYNDKVIYPEKVRLNLAYLDNWTLRRDLGYILVTVAPGISHKLGIRHRLGLD
ncbi:sugar transferase [Desulfoferrobacter suflitae]|uniref:sugar transferase n=1 Tax=Desulfoferrobacter suflitae TaxID=2865782 RepID=UPI0021640836|nr:sugar transferase [Desulfoferrobacter suflitae]MCK8604350.1 sugar transferase [Desulfoferrobacter suflitae]